MQRQRREPPKQQPPQKQWLTIYEVMSLTGWSYDHARRHLQRLFYAGSPAVINSALSRQARHLQISTEGLDNLLLSMSGAASAEGSGVR